MEKKKFNECIKPASIVLLVIAIITFLFASKKIYQFSVDEPLIYEVRFELLNLYEKGVTKVMETTGRIQSKVLDKRNNNRDNKYDIFDDVSRKHK